MSVKDKEQIQIVLPACDLFSEELKVYINNIDLNVFNRRADIKIYNADNIELDHKMIDREFVVLYTVCQSFYVLYTN